ncbi:hypothetical protein ACLOJK_010078 [Asimina triloba]
MPPSTLQVKLHPDRTSQALLLIVLCPSTSQLTNSSSSSSSTSGLDFGRQRMSGSAPEYPTLAWPESDQITREEKKLNRGQRSAANRTGKRKLDDRLSPPNLTFSGLSLSRTSSSLDWFTNWNNLFLPLLFLSLLFLLASACMFIARLGVHFLALWLLSLKLLYLSIRRRQRHLFIDTYADSKHMENMQYAEDLIREFLVFRGFTYTLQAFETELSTDIGKGFEVDKIMDLVFSLYIPKFQAEKLVNLLSFLKQCFSSSSEMVLISTLSKLEISTEKNTIKHLKKDIKQLNDKLLELQAILESKEAQLSQLRRF